MVFSGVANCLNWKIYCDDHSSLSDFAMLPAQRFWRETVSLLDAMRLRSNQSDQVVAGCKTFLQKVESSSTSCNTICSFCAFYRPKANMFWCFVANDATPVYGVTPAYQKSEFTQLNHLICSVAKQVWPVGDKTHNTAFQLALKQCCKTSCTFVLPILPQLTQKW